MTLPKVLLLHGPLNSVGTNLIVQRFYPDPVERKRSWAAFNCEQNIIALSVTFRALGFKICYSGWNEDRAWLEANSGLFDNLVIVDQSGLKEESMFVGRAVPNNKEKFYYSAWQGLCEIERATGSDALVFRLRSDIAVRPDLAAAELDKVHPGSGRLMIEYLNAANMLAVPDFMLAGELRVMKTIYGDMFQRSRAGEDFHISSHIDHSLTYILLQQAGLVGEIQCMGRLLYDSMVWRGIPRYFEQTVAGADAQQLVFDALLAVPPGFDVHAQVRGAAPPAVS
ncbi:MAG TPA: hypothetical protein VF774_27065 [Pseudoduganella sp.]|jgi:hypothetical protein